MRKNSKKRLQIDPNTYQLVEEISISEELSVPITYWAEPGRSGWRISLGARTCHIRIPPSNMQQLRTEVFEWAFEWLQKTYQRKPQLFDRYKQQRYYDGLVYNTLFGTYTLHIEDIDEPHVTLQLVKDELLLKKPTGWMNGQEVEKSIARLMGRRHRAQMELWTRRINEQTFAFPFRKFFLRYNSSNWGSCSTSGNIQINSKLLLAPEEIARSVIIHELAHLKEANHGERFWQLVELYDPDHLQHKEWLDNQGMQLRY